MIFFAERLHKFLKKIYITDYFRDLVWLKKFEVVVAVIFFVMVFFLVRYRLNTTKYVLQTNKQSMKNAKKIQK